MVGHDWVKVDLYFGSYYQKSKQRAKAWSLFIVLHCVFVQRRKVLLSYTKAAPLMTGDQMNVRGMMSKQQSGQQGEGTQIYRMDKETHTKFHPKYMTLPVRGRIALDDHSLQIYNY